MWKSIIVFGVVVFISLPAFAQESKKYTEIPLNFLDQGKEGTTLGDLPNFLRENSIAVQNPLFGLEKVERMPIAKGPADFHSNMPLIELSDSLNYRMPILREKKEW